MPRTIKPEKASISTAEKVQEKSSTHEESLSLDQEQDPKSLSPTTSDKVVPNMFMPYIEGPKTDWTVNDSLHHRFLKWCLKCEDILDCELDMLPEKRCCKNVIAWNGDFGMDQYVCGACPLMNLCLIPFGEKLKSFCKPQSNEMRARSDLLTSFQQGNKSVDE